MESGGMVFDSSNMTTVLLKNEKLPCSADVLDSLWISSSSPSFHVSGSASMVNFEDVHPENSTDRPFFDKEENSSDDYDGCFRQPEKKRRLSPDQVRFLEKSFEVENKLEPERKIQLAKEIGLQPRQVAIWYQNRRARYKTKQLEKDYSSLKATYDKIKADHDCLFKENEKLKNEVHLLKEKLHQRDKEEPKSRPCDPTSPLKSSLEPHKSLSTGKVSPKTSNIPMVICKQEDATSAKSDVFDSDSPHYTDGIHSSILEPSDSSHIFDSDFSQDEEDNPSRRLMPPPCFAKLEDECYDDLQLNSCSLGFDQSTWLWPLIE